MLKNCPFLSLTRALLITRLTQPGTRLTDLLHEFSNLQAQCLACQNLTSSPALKVSYTTHFTVLVILLPCVEPCSSKAGHHTRTCWPEPKLLKTNSQTWLVDRWLIRSMTGSSNISKSPSRLQSCCSQTAIIQATNANQEKYAACTTAQVQLPLVQVCSY